MPRYETRRPSPSGLSGKVSRNALHGHGRHDEATGEPADIAADDEDRIRDAMAEAQEHPGRIVTR